jgi:nucleoside recognition membrane protein YjiH
MTGDQVTLLGIAGIAAAAWALKGIASKYIEQRFKNKRKEISLKKSLARNETKKKLYECLESLNSEAVNGMRSVIEGTANSQAKRA